MKNSCTHVYCRECIDKHISTKTAVKYKGGSSALKCPCCSAALSKRTLVDVHGLKDTVEFTKALIERFTAMTKRAVLSVSDGPLVHSQIDPSTTSISSAAPTPAVPEPTTTQTSQSSDIIGNTSRGRTIKRPRKYLDDSEDEVTQTPRRGAQSIVPRKKILTTTVELCAESELPEAPPQAAQAPKLPQRPVEPASVTTPRESRKEPSKTRASESSKSASGQESVSRRQDNSTRLVPDEDSSQGEQTEESKDLYKFEASPSKDQAVKRTRRGSSVSSTENNDNATTETEGTEDTPSAKRPRGRPPGRAKFRLTHQKQNAAKRAALSLQRAAKGGRRSSDQTPPLGRAPIRIARPRSKSSAKRDGEQDKKEGEGNDKNEEDKEEQARDISPTIRPRLPRYRQPTRKSIESMEQNLPKLRTRRLSRTSDSASKSNSARASEAGSLDDRESVHSSRPAKATATETATTTDEKSSDDTTSSSVPSSPVKSHSVTKPLSISKSPLISEHNKLSAKALLLKKKSPLSAARRAAINKIKMANAIGKKEKLETLPRAVDTEESESEHMNFYVEKTQRRPPTQMQPKRKKLAVKSVNDLEEPQLFLDPNTIPTFTTSTPAVSTKPGPRSFSGDVTPVASPVRTEEPHASQNTGFVARPSERNIYAKSHNRLKSDISAPSPIDMNFLKSSHFDKIVKMTKIYKPSQERQDREQSVERAREPSRSSQSVRERRESVMSQRMEREPREEPYRAQIMMGDDEVGDNAAAAKSGDKTPVSTPVKTPVKSPRTIFIKNAAQEREDALYKRLSNLFQALCTEHGVEGIINMEGIGHIEFKLTKPTNVAADDDVFHSSQSQVVRASRDKEAQTDRDSPEMVDEATETETESPLKKGRRIAAEQMCCAEVQTDLVDDVVAVQYEDYVEPGANDAPYVPIGYEHTTYENVPINCDPGAEGAGYMLAFEPGYDQEAANAADQQEEVAPDQETVQDNAALVTNGTATLVKDIDEDSMDKFDEDDDAVIEVAKRSHGDSMEEHQNGTAVEHLANGEIDHPEATEKPSSTLDRAKDCVSEELLNSSQVLREVQGMYHAAEQDDNEVIPESDPEDDG